MEEKDDLMGHMDKMKTEMLNSRIQQISSCGVDGPLSLHPTGVAVAAGREVVDSLALDM